MRLREFVPGIGNYFLHKRLTNDQDMSFKQKAYSMSIGSAYSAGLTISAMNTNILAANKVRYVTSTSPISGIITMFASATAAFPEIAGKQYQSSITQQPTASDTRLVFNTGEGLGYFRF